MTKNTSSDDESVDTTQEEVIDTPVDPVDDKPAEVTLKLKENNFVLGDYYPAGTTRTFPRAEAERLLVETTMWEAVGL
jgi:hypothetical protein